MSYLRKCRTFVCLTGTALLLCATSAAANSNNQVTITAPTTDYVNAIPDLTWDVDGSFLESPTCKLAKYGGTTLYDDFCNDMLRTYDPAAGIYDYSWDLSSLLQGENGGDGTYAFTFTPFWANAGGPSSVSQVFTLDTIAPTVSASAPLGWTNDNTPAVGYTVFDANPGTTYCAVDPADSGDLGDYSACAEDSFDLPAVSDGVHSFWVTHVDLAGNSASAFKQFTVDATPPQIAISGLVGGQVLTNAYPAISVSSSDSGSGNATLQCAWDAFALGSCTDPSFTNAILADGNHTLTVIASDVLGNVNTQTIAFTVDTTAGLKQGLIAPKKGKFKIKRGKLKGSKYKATTTTTFTIPAGGDATACKGTARTRVMLKKKQLGSGKVKWKAKGSSCIASSTVKLSKKYKRKKLTLILDYKNGPIKAFRIKKTLKF